MPTKSGHTFKFRNIALLTHFLRQRFFFFTGLISLIFLGYQESPRSHIRDSIKQDHRWGGGVFRGQSIIPASVSFSPTTSRSSRIGVPKLRGRNPQNHSKLNTLTSENGDRIFHFAGDNCARVDTSGLLDIKIFFWNRPSLAVSSFY